MSVKRRAFVFAALTVVFLAVTVCTLTGLYLILPGYAKSVIFPEVANELGISRFTCGVRRIGLTGADFGPITIGDRNNEALSIGAARIDYSLTGLLAKRIDRISLSGVELACEIENGKVGFPGFDLEAFLAKARQTRDNKNRNRNSTFRIGKLEIRNAAVAFKWNKKNLMLPVDIGITPGDSGFDKVHCVAGLCPMGQKFECVSYIDFNSKSISLGIAARDFRLESFSEFYESAPGLALSGEADLNGDVRVKLDPFRVDALNASLEVRKYIGEYGGVKFADRDAALTLNIIGQAKDGFYIAADSLSMISPMPVRADFVCSLSDNWDFSGDVSATFKKFGGSRLLPFSIRKPFAFSEKFRAERKKGTWSFAIGGPETSDKKLEIGINGWTIAAGFPKIEFNGNRKLSKGAVKTNLVLKDVAATSDSVEIVIPKLSVISETKFDSEKIPHTSFKTAAKDALFTAGTTKVEIPAVSFSGTVKQRLKGLVKIDGAEVSRPGMKFERVDAHLPVQWPLDGPGPKGEIKAAGVLVKNSDIGPVAGEAWQAGTGIGFDMIHRSLVVPGFDLNLKGEVKTEPELSVGVDYSAGHTGEIDPGVLFAGGKGVSVNGDFELEGKLAYGKSGGSCSLSLEFENGSVQIPEKGAAFDGTGISLYFPDLFELRGAPKQRFSFDRASFGSITLDSGEIEFQIESAKSIFIEKVGISWCGGSVFTQAFRIKPGVDDYDLVLYCDRLNFAAILEQMGVGSVSGKGSVNGRIPVRYANGKVFFNDGFLFSTPGDGCKISVAGMEDLTAGIPEGTLEYAQIDLAREALKDFEYKWAKLSMDSEGEDLNMRLQFDGKPANPLPFKFDRDLGRFARMRAGGKKSHFQGIQLDVNIAMPLNEILRYKNFIKLIR